MSDNKFLESLHEFQLDFQSIQQDEKDLLAYRDQLSDKLKKIKLGDISLNKDNDLLQQSIKLKKTIQRSIASWADTWEKSSPMRELSDTYSDRVILLVFGKVNAGKSSFSNFLTSLFPDIEVKRFSLFNGKRKYTKKIFKEGVVETTAEIQGVELGNYLVLLDTPGLHSVTDENGDLTRIFTDSADAILWLTPSTSPGQVQELDDLRDELRSNKPLLPIITRSDSFDEDIDENDNLIRILKNKSADNRKLQEDDVYERATDKLKNSNTVKKPISISVHAYLESKRNSSDQNNAGMTNLYDKLADIIEEAKRYKIIKAKQQVENYLRDGVLIPLDDNVVPQITNLMDTSNKAISNLKLKKESIVAEVSLNVVSEIPNLIERHKVSQDKKAISSELNDLTLQYLIDILQRELEEYTNKINSISCALSPDDLGDFEDITIDIKQVKGSSAKAATSSAVATVGALAGSIIPGVGTLIGTGIGGLIGGWLGSKAGNYFVETETIAEQVGISTEKMIYQTTNTVKQLLPTLINSIVDEIIQSIMSVQLLAKECSNAITEFKKQVNQLGGKNDESI